MWDLDDHSRRPLFKKGLFKNPETVSDGELVRSLLKQEERPQSFLIFSLGDI